MFLDSSLNIEVHKLVLAIIICGIALALLGLAFFIKRDNPVGIIPSTVGAIAIFGGSIYLFLSTRQ